MTNRENYLGIARRQGYEYMPVHFSMCPNLQERFEQYRREHDLFIPEGPSHVGPLPMICGTPAEFETYYRDNPIRAGAHCIYLERDIKNRLNRYAKDEDITDVWIWAEHSGNDCYDIYVGYA